MPYDEALTARMPQALDGLVGVEEKKMMGGVCFMVNGHMLCGARHDNEGNRRFMFRVGKENMEQALREPEAYEMQIGAKTLGGFLHVDEENCNDKCLAKWMSRCLTFNASLPDRD